MTKQRRRRIGMLIKAGAKVYNLLKEKWETLKKDVEITDWSDHIGHIRFGIDGVRYSYVTRYKKGKEYEVIYA